jgi:hypothetical protein
MLTLQKIKIIAIIVRVLKELSKIGHTLVDEGDPTVFIVDAFL